MKARNKRRIIKKIVRHIFAPPKPKCYVCGGQVAHIYIKYGLDFYWSARIWEARKYPKIAHKLKNIGVEL